MSNPDTHGEKTKGERLSVVKIMLKVLITSAFQLLPFQAPLRDVFFFNSIAKLFPMQTTTIKNNHTDHQYAAAHMPDQWVAVTNQDEKFHTQCSTSTPFYGLWILLQATARLSPPEPILVSFLYLQFQAFFCAAKTEALLFHLKTGSRGL